MADINNRGQFRAWLGKQPREVAVALAARAALRVLPVVQTAKHEGSIGVLVMPVFRATVISWAVAKYPAQQMKLAIAAADAYAAAVSAAAAAAVAASAADAAAVRADANAYTVAAAPSAPRAADAYAAVAATAAADAAAARGADVYAAVTAVRAAAAAARAAAARAGDAFAAATYAVAYAGDADCAAASADARTYAVTTAYADARTYPVTAADTAAVAYAAASFFWSALSIDAARLEKGAAASGIASSPLWPQGQPDWLQSLWQEMKAALQAAKQDWQVWATWYDDRLDGRVREEECELAYVRIDEAQWYQDPAIVNAEIRRRIEKRAPPTLAG